ncbi:InlB B-repeat-containing protein [Candidatus Methanarcanum hacksteinii]|uniref:InlB B-repeat-containing protein n=1 Tax=Candidatus Methanarcanum hacksteinii TaxID=2911857 RepID=UPI0037DD789B
MRKILAVCAAVLVVISSTVILLGNETAVATPASYSFTYGDYTVTQDDVSKNGSLLTVRYSLEGNNVNCSYDITYGITQDGVLSTKVYDKSFDSNGGKIAKVGESALEVLIIPPKVVVSENEEYSLGKLEGALSSNSFSETKTLIISTNGAGLSTDGNSNVIRSMSALETLVVDSVLTHGGSNFINGCPKLSDVYIREMGIVGNTTNNFWNIGTLDSSVTGINVSFKATGNTNFPKMNGTSVPINVKLLPGSVKASFLNFTNVTTVLLDSAYWDSNVTASELATNVTPGSATTIYFYGSSQPALYSVSIAQNQTGVSVNAENASEGDVVTITLTPGQGKQVEAVSVVKEDNGVVQTTVDAQNPNVYTFTMPASDVTVSAIFEDIPAVAITPVSDTVAKGASTTVTVSAVGLKNVSSLYITITYDEAKFNLKSPAYSNLLDSAALKGDLTKGEYVVAFASAQNISGDLLTFQLEAKDDAAVGACTIGCTVEINGTASGNSNTPRDTYSETSTLTIGNLLGDLDSDGDVDEDDAVYLLLYTFRASTHPIPEGQNVDYNNDGVINSDDAIYLKNYVVNPTQYPLGGA